MIANSHLLLVLLTSAASLHAAEWRPLFNGKDLKGWTTLVKDRAVGEDPDRYVSVADGMIHMYADTPDGQKVAFGVITTEESFSSYHLKLEYRWGTKKFAPRAKPEHKRDAGILYHVWNPSKVWPGSLEYQIQETDTGDLIFIDSGGTFFHEPGDPKRHLPESEGGFARYGLAKNTWQLVAKRKVADRNEGWNTAEIIVHGGRSAEHLVNGESLLCLSNFVRPEGDGTVPLSSGKISLQFEGAEIFYRNIVIRELPPTITAEPPALALSAVGGQTIPSGLIEFGGKTDLDKLTVTGRDAGHFSIAPAMPTSVRVTFDPKGRTGDFHAALRGDGDLVVPLHGLGTQALEGENEAPLFRVARALALPVEIGAETLITPKDGKPIGSGIVASRFRPINGQPVVMTPLARYSPPWELPFGIYQEMGGERKQLEAGRLQDSIKVKDAHQRLFPPLVAGKTTALNPTGPFGIYTISPTHTAYSDPSLNEGNVKSNPQALRVYPVKEILGRPLENAYLLCFEEAKNGDYQDYVFLIENVVAE
jgi:hypothetical protein